MNTSELDTDSSGELRALLGDWLRVRHLSQPLYSIDANRNCLSKTATDGLGYSVVGVKDQGRTIGSVPVDALRQVDWCEQVQPVSEVQVIDGDSPLLELLRRLAGRHWLFVRHGGKLNGFVSRSDLQRAPFRMFLFGLISLFEMRLLHLVKQYYSDATIAMVLNDNRFGKAQRLHEERKLRGEELALADCLQIADKRDLLLALPDSAAKLGFTSKKQASRFFAQVEALRDRLVHANDLIAGSTWEEVLAVTIELADFLNPVKSHSA